MQNAAKKKSKPRQICVKTIASKYSNASYDHHAQQFDKKLQSCG
jgi:hypothetical protein